jgi:putative addiction module component (TIGR02574 family)
LIGPNFCYTLGVEQREQEDTVSVDTILSEAKTLSTDDKVRLLEELWLQINEETEEPSLSEAEWAEIRRRRDELEHQPQRGMSWEQLKAYVTRSR